MAWFKLDDGFESHPKVKSIPRPRRLQAIGLWALAGSWSARQLTDGYVPDFMLAELAATEDDAAALVAADLWSVEADGFRFQNWSEYQPTKATVEAKREESRLRMEAVRKSRRANGSQSVRANTSRTSANTSDGSREVRSTRPDPSPSRPEPVPDSSNEESVVPTEAGLPEDRPDVDRICTALADAIEANGCKRPTIGQGWHDSGRLLLDKDGRTEAEVMRAIAWCQADEFWRSNIMSMPKLREKYDTLRLQATRGAHGNGGRNAATSGILDRALARIEAREAAADADEPARELVGR